MTTDIKKICPYCKKEVFNLVAHIIRNHPLVLEKIEEVPAESAPPEVKISPVSPNLPAQNVKIGDISALIREKLDIMLNIKIIEMLSRSPDISIQDISKAINPPQKSTLEEIKEYHDLLYGNQPPYIETGNQWVDIAQQALPIIKEMLPRKKREMQAENITEEDLNVRTGNGTAESILKPIQLEIAGDTKQSAGNSQESGINSKTIKPTN